MKKIIFLLLGLWLQAPVYPDSSLCASITPVVENVSCNLSAPGSFTGSFASPSTANLSWNAVSGASAYQYRVYELSAGGSTGTLIGGGQVSGTSTTIYNLQTGKNYRVFLSSVCPDTSVSNDITSLDLIGA